MAPGKRSDGGGRKRPGKSAAEAGAESVQLAPAASEAEVTSGAAAAPADPLMEFFVSENEQREVAQSYGNDAFQGTSTMVREMAELLAFWVADEEYAVDILEIQEIIKVPVITEVPRTDPMVLGITSLRGTIVPVLDLRRVLKLEERPATRATRILVLRAEGDPVGLLVDRVTSVVRLDKDSIEPVPRTMKADAGDLLRGVGRLGERLLIVLELAGIFSLMEHDG